MKTKDVQLGKVYLVKVSDVLHPVRLDKESPYGGWNGTNLSTKRDVRIHSAQRLRCELERNPATGKWRPVTKAPTPATPVVQFPCCGAWGNRNPNHVCDGPREESDNS